MCITADFAILSSSSSSSGVFKAYVKLSMTVIGYLVLTRQTGVAFNTAAVSGATCGNKYPLIHI
jgi:hypothetical protein